MPQIQLQATRFKLQANTEYSRKPKAKSQTPSRSAAQHLELRT